MTCDEQNDGLGGILAFGAKSLLIDGTSKIDMAGKGKSQVSCMSFTKSGVLQVFFFFSLQKV